MYVEDARVIEHQEMQGGYRLLVMEAPFIVPHVQPGQFVHLRVPHMEEAVLRRPFSIFKAEGKDRLSLLYKNVGRGTRTLTLLRPDETVSLLGPLGHGFPVDGKGRPVLVAGGYGMAALYMVARDLPVTGHAFFGGASAQDILCVEEFKALGWTVHVTTEDGTLGTKGLVTDILDVWLEEEGGEDIEFHACGPNGMLKAVSDRAVARACKAWVSVDRNMGCGVGACLTCVVKVHKDGDWVWARSCKEGPVFECREVIWEDPA